MKSNNFRVSRLTTASIISVTTNNTRTMAKGKPIIQQCYHHRSWNNCTGSTADACFPNSIQIATTTRTSISSCRTRLTVSKIKDNTIRTTRTQQNKFYNDVKSKNIQFKSHRMLSNSSTSSNGSGRSSNTNDRAAPLLKQFSSLFTLVGTWYSSQLDKNPIITKSITSGFVSCVGDLICQTLQLQECARIDTTKRTFDADNSNTMAASSLSLSTTNTNSNYDWNRTIRFWLLGTFIVGPVCHSWYGFLATRVVSQSSLSSSSANAINTVMKPVLIDQIFFAPIFLIAWTSSFQFIEALQQQHTYHVFLEIIQPKSDIEDRNQNATTTRTTDTTQSSSFSSNVLLKMLYVNWMIWIPAQGINFKYVPVKYRVLFSNIVAVTWNIYLSYATAIHGVQKYNTEDNKK
jgi:Mpv17 / PMP22 family